MDEQDYEEFVSQMSRHHRRISWFLSMLLPDQADCDDVMQETSIVLWRKWSEFDKSRDFCTWAFSIARRQALQFIRQGNAERVHLTETALAAVASEAENYSVELAREEDRREALSLCLDKLGDREREVIEARYFQDATAKSIAAGTGRPLQTIYATLSRARSQLADCVRRRLAALESAG